MKSLMAEIEQKYTEFCIKEDAEAAQREAELAKENEESNSEDEKPISAKNEE